MDFMYFELIHVAHHGLITRQDKSPGVRIESKPLLPTLHDYKIKYPKKNRKIVAVTPLLGSASSNEMWLSIL